MALLTLKAMKPKFLQSLLQVSQGLASLTMHTHTWTSLHQKELLCFKLVKSKLITPFLPLPVARIVVNILLSRPKRMNVKEIRHHLPF